MDLTPIRDMVEEAEKHAEDHSEDRIKATNYYQGEMTDTPSEPGRSSFVSRDLRAQVKKVLPSVMRVIFGSDQVVEYQPVGEGDEDQAEQATDYINAVVIPEAKVRVAVHDAIHDALVLRNGILKWWWEDKKRVRFSKHSGLTEDELAALVEDDAVQIVERDERQEDIALPQPDGSEVLQPITFYDVKLRREESEGRVCVSAVPREDFLIDPDATTIEESILTGQKSEVKRSDLVAMGYDRNRVNEFAAADDTDDEAYARRMVDGDRTEAQKANDPITYYDLYVRIDLDNDGIAELRHMTFAGGLAEENLLENDEVDEVQYCDVCAMRQPHQWEGVSLADDLMPVQRVKTVLLRETLDNFYQTNKPRPVYDTDALEDEGDVLEWAHGAPIRLRAGRDARTSVSWLTTPLFASDSFAMLGYMDEAAQDTTGVSDASAGLPPDALQNVTAKASAMMEQQGIGQTEYIVETIADSLKPLFSGLLRLTVRHQDKERTVRLRDEWVSFDPRHWNADMDLSVNTGLGAGTRERDMQMMQQIVLLQEKMLAGFGPDNPFVKPENVWNAISKLAEASGLKTPRLYFTEPDPEEVAQKMEAMRNAPDPEMEKAKLDAQTKMAVEDKKQETQRAKEQAQMQADLTIKQAEIEAESKRQSDEFAYKSASEERQLQWEREKLATELQFKRWEAEQKRQDEILKHQAEAMRAEDQAKRDDDRWQAEREDSKAESAA